MHTSESPAQPHSVSSASCTPSADLDYPSLLGNYRCDKCKLKVTAKKWLQVLRPPRVLSLQLKRFAFSPASTFGSSKESKRIKFDQTLDLKPYMAEKALAEMGTPQAVDASLFAVIVHQVIHSPLSLPPWRLCGLHEWR